MALRNRTHTCVDRLYGDFDPPPSGKRYEQLSATAAEGPARALLERDDDEITEEDLIAGLIDELS